MSGHPNNTDIRELREALSEIVKEREAISKAEADLRHQEVIISCAKERLDKHERKVRDLLSCMDCEPNGNAGSERRMIALLTGLATEAAQAARTRV